MRNKMKTIVTIISAAIILTACNSTPISEEDSKRRELQKYRQEVRELQAKIEVIENELSGSIRDESVKISVTELTGQRFEHFIAVTGNVEADLDINVSPESPGIIKDVLVTEGQQVSKGELLGRLNTNALERSLDELQIQLDLAETNFKRQKNLWDQNIGSEMQFLQARTNVESLIKRIEGVEAQISMSEIKSPVDGVVDIVYQKTGEMGSPQIPFARVLNIQTVRIYADVSESYITSIKPGDMVKINFPALNLEMEAPIRRIGNIIDPNNRTFRVRIDLQNRNRMIKPNLISIVQIRDYMAEDVIVIPTLYVKEDFRGKFTFIVENDQETQRARKVHIETGRTQNNRTEVVKGLTDGMKIISEGYNQVSDGTPVAF
jgi:membrane fusion protein, multidrug efflux system